MIQNTSNSFGTGVRIISVTGIKFQNWKSFFDSLFTTEVPRYKNEPNLYAVVRFVASSPSPLLFTMNLIRLAQN